MSQVIQSSHAAIQFQHEHPKLAREWYIHSNYLIFLSMENKQELETFIEKTKTLNIVHSIFREPDINNEITAIALNPCVESNKITSGLKLLK